MSMRYGIVPVSFLNHAEITSADIAIYTAIASFADKNGKAFPGRCRIAKLSKLKKSWVSKRIKHMENLGFISVLRDRGHTNKYRLLQHPLRREEQ